MPKKKTYNIHVLRSNKKLPESFDLAKVEGISYKDKEKGIEGFVHKRFPRSDKWVLSDYYSGAMIVKADRKKDIPDKLHDLFIRVGYEEFHKRLNEYRKIYKANE